MCVCVSFINAQICLWISRKINSSSFIVEFVYIIEWEWSEIINASRWHRRRTPQQKKKTFIVMNNHCWCVSSAKRGVHHECNFRFANSITVRYFRTICVSEYPERGYWGCLEVPLPNKKYRFQPNVQIRETYPTVYQLPRSDHTDVSRGAWAFSSHLEIKKMCSRDREKRTQPYIGMVTWWH